MQDVGRTKQKVYKSPDRGEWLQNFLKWSQLQAKAPNQMESKLKRFFVTLAGNGNLLFIGLTLFASILDSFSGDAF